MTHFSEHTLNKREKNIKQFLLGILYISKYGIMICGLVYILFMSYGIILNYVILLLPLLLVFPFDRLIKRYKRRILVLQMSIYLEEIEQGKLSQEEIKNHKLFDRVKDMLHE